MQRVGDTEAGAEGRFVGSCEVGRPAEHVGDPAVAALIRLRGRQTLRPLENARTLRPGTDDPIVKMRGCPDCDGWGWICLNPFAAFNRRIVQCPTCEDAKLHFDKHGTIPDDIAAAMSQAEERRAQQAAEEVTAPKRRRRTR